MECTTVVKAVYFARWGLLGAYKSTDTRMPEINMDSEYLNLANFLSQYNHPHIEVYYGLKNSIDLKAAENIKGSVTLHGYETEDHNIGSYLKREGLLDDILESI